MAVRTFLLMGLIRSLDCYRNVPLTFKMWGSMFTKFNFSEMFGGGVFSLGLSLFDYVVVGCGCVVMYFVSRAGKETSVRERIYSRPVFSWCLVGALIIAVVMLGAYSIGYDASQFIYNQF